MFQNLMLGVSCPSITTATGVFSRAVLTSLPLLENSDDFVFDNEMLAQCIWFNFRIGEISCPTKYFEEASSISFKRSMKYGLGVVATTMKFALERLGVAHFRIFSPRGKKLDLHYYGSGADERGSIEIEDGHPHVTP